MRRTIWVMVGVAAVGLVIGSVSMASEGPANSSNPHVVKVITRATAVNDFVDTGAPGFSPGDLYVFSERVFMASAPDEQVGTEDGRCVLIDPAALRFDCSITGKLPEGEIMVAGTLTLVEGSTSTFAVVGGTGAYRQARGEARSVLGPFEGPHEVTVELILNP
jgi:Allene oxide cyclase barrel like domain